MNALKTVKKPHGYFHLHKPNSMQFYLTIIDTELYYQRIAEELFSVYENVIAASVVWQ